MAFEVFETPVTIRFDGLDAERHELEIEAFARSIRGFGRIISVAAQFAATQKYVQHKDAMDIRVVVAPPHPNCVTVATIVQWVTTSPLGSATASGLLVLLIGYIFKRAAGQKEEMRHLKDALETAIRELGNRDQKVVDRLLDTVDKMADSLKPAARQAVTPIGRTAKTVTVGGEGLDDTQSVVLGGAEREGIEAREPTEITGPHLYGLLITELNLDKNTCRVAFPDDLEARYPAEITDPIIQQPNNAYSLAFAAKEPITVMAKAVIKEGALSKLYISDTV